ncbi:Dabb family protein [Streptomyces sp. 11x1]|uniref:Dabb family protein n=1 Tax=Streptomyces sp. 11x1 TaxID=3038642 RepID=UPI00292DAC85|nr:Dabb family protein [Streptomyces sp. 11x1]WNZ12911.1 Dabb family protein [Streptomyces sp. 11x1]
MSITHISLWWLKEPDNSEHHSQIQKALESLRDVPGVRDLTYGPVLSGIPKPAGTYPRFEQAVSALPIEYDATYDYGISITFDSTEGVDAYQPHPVHVAAVDVIGQFTRRIYTLYFDDSAVHAGAAVR